jgi:hypothetical protein
MDSANCRRESDAAPTFLFAASSGMRAEEGTKLDAWLA